MPNPEIYKYGKSTQFKQVGKPKSKRNFTFRPYEEDLQKIIKIPKEKRADFFRDAISKSLKELD